MARLHLLGTGASLSSPDRTTTMLALENDGSVILVDCGADPIHRMLTVGLDPGRIDLVVLTHGHPDHITGFPLLVQKVWLAKRGRDLPVLGPRRALEQARQLFEVFDTEGWQGLPRIEWRVAEEKDEAESWRNDLWSISTSPTQHGSTPSVALRVTDLRSGRAVAYSSDTERSEAVARLARGAAILVHEATGGFPGHSTAEDAAWVAREAGVERLVLVHLPPDADTMDLDAARRHYPAIQLGHDGDVLAF
ncbi:MAG TPA: MBL fold metallo-hydrolase [Longimicrobiaceae bacterium]